MFQKNTLNQNDTLKVETDYMRDPISMACKEAQILDLRVTDDNLSQARVTQQVKVTIVSPQKIHLSLFV